MLIPLYSESLAANLGEKIFVKFAYLLEIVVKMLVDFKTHIKTF